MASSQSPPGGHASPPSPATVKEALSPRPKLVNLDSAQKYKKPGPISPTLSDSEEEHQLRASPTSPTRPLASISEGEDDDTDDPETEHARTEGMRTVEAEIKSGYLYKKGERRRQWKKRWFVLRSKRISYYKDAKEYKLLRDISMNDVSTVAEVQVKRHDHVFGIVTAQRTYYIEARSHADLQDWVSQIEHARDLYKRNSLEEGSTMEDGPDTPTRRPQDTPTPTGHPHTQPISIVGAATSSGAYGSSSAATSSTSPMSPDGQSSSYTSQGSGSPRLPPMVPPNSYVQTESMSLGKPADLDTVDARLAGSRQRENSATGSANEVSVMHRRQTSTSPGVVSSSEDEDDDYFGDAASPLGQQVGSPLQAGSLDPNKLIMSGYLTKQGKRKNWRKRYFFLVSSRLMYSRSHMDQKIHRSIPLARILDVVDVEGPTVQQRGRSESSILETHSSPILGGVGPGNEKRYDNSFKIITAKRTYTVCAPDEESAIKWLSAIKVLLSAQRSQMSSPETQKATLPSMELQAPVAASLAQPILSVASSPSQQQQRSPGTAAPSAESMPSIESKLEQASLTDRTSLPSIRQRSATEAAKLAVREAGERFSARA